LPKGKKREPKEKRSREGVLCNRKEAYILKKGDWEGETSSTKEYHAIKQRSGERTAQLNKEYERKKRRGSDCDPVKNIYFQREEVTHPVRARSKLQCMTELRTKRRAKGIVILLKRKRTQEWKREGGSRNSEIDNRRERSRFRKEHAKNRGGRKKRPLGGKSPK